MDQCNNSAGRILGFVMRLYGDKAAGEKAFYISSVASALGVSASPESILNGLADLAREADLLRNEIHHFNTVPMKYPYYRRVVAGVLVMLNSIKFDKSTGRGTIKMPKDLRMGLVFLAADMQQEPTVLESD